MRFVQLTRSPDNSWRLLSHPPCARLKGCPAIATRLALVKTTSTGLSSCDPLLLADLKYIRCQCIDFNGAELPPIGGHRTHSLGNSIAQLRESWLESIEIGADRAASIGGCKAVTDTTTGLRLIIEDRLARQSLI